MIDNSALNQFVQDQIRLVLQSQVDSAVQDFVAKTIDSLVIDQEWLSKIESLATQTFKDKVLESLSGCDISTAISQQIDNSLDRWQDKLIQSYRAGGIVDQASSIQLTALDGTVVVENQLVASDLALERDGVVKGSLTVNNLAVTGAVNVDNQSWQGIVNQAVDKTIASLTEQWQQNLVKQVLELSKTQGIDFDSVTVQGQPLVQGNALSPRVVSSDLRKVGVLEKLSVSGDAEIFDTVYVNKHRMGINTNAPEAALSVWDEEVCVITGKHKQNHAYVGTSRNQNISLGVNRTAYLTIDTDGLTSVQKFRVDRWQIGFASEVPGWSGTRGDLVLNSDPKPNSPFAWVCLGAYRWQSLRSA